MSAEDMAMNSNVRNILAQFFVDSNQVYVSSHGGTVYLRGKLFSKSDSPKPLGGNAIQAMENAIRNQKGVKKVLWQLDNWKMIGTKWREE